jgi:hypothetical protein
MSHDFQRDYLIRLPLPLAQLYQRAYNDKSAQSRHNNTFYLFEALAALLGRLTGRDVGAGQLDALAQQSAAETPSVEALLGPPPTAARVLGDYAVLAEIGRGGMGVVYLARQLSLGRLVALKMLPADLAGDEVALARFRREMRLMARCDHPHIVYESSADPSPVPRGDSQPPVVRCKRRPGRSPNPRSPVPSVERSERRWERSRREESSLRGIPGSKVVAFDQRCRRVALGDRNGIGASWFY